MVIQNSLQLLKELSSLEEKISKLEKLSAHQYGEGELLEILNGEQRKFKEPKTLSN